jgi:uncharacterized protein involved in outer membrane biogenesis
MRRVLKLVGFLAVVLILFIIVSGLAVYHLVRVGEVHRFLSAEIERRTELHTQLGGADLEIGWITGIAFNNLALSEPGASEPAITAQKVTARLALLPLLRRQVIFYEIRLQQPVAQFVRDPQGRLPLLDKLLNLQFFKEQDSEFSLDLPSIKVENADIALLDQRREKGLGKWRAVNVDVDIERLRGQRLRAYMDYLLKRQPAEPDAAAIAFELKGVVLRDEARINLKAQGRLAFPEKTLEFHRAHWDGDIDLVNFPAALIKDHIGSRLPIKSMAGYLAQRVHVEGNPETSLRVKGTVEFRQLSIEAPELFLAPLAGVDGRATFAIERNRQNVQITQADFRTNDVQFSLQGAVAAIDGENPHLRLTGSVLPAPAASVLKYLPVKLAGSSRLENFLSAIQSGQVEIKRARVDASLNQLRWLLDSSAKQFSLEADLREFAGTPGVAGALPLRGVSGKIRVANGVLGLENFRGAYGDSRFNDVDASYDFAGAAPGNLDLHTRGEINLAELKEQLKSLDLPPKTAKMLSSVQDLSGRGKVQLAIKSLPNAPIQFDGTAALDHVRVRYDEFSLSELQGDLAFSPKEIKSEQIRAQLAGSPIQIRLALKDYDAEDATFDLHIDSTGLKAGVISNLLLDTGSPRDEGLVRGAVRYFGSLNDKKQRKFTGDLDLFNVQLLVKPLLQPLRELNGKIKIDESGIAFQDLKALLVGVPASASGRWRYGQRPQLLFDFSAPSLDITYLISQIDPESSDFYATLIAQGKISLSKGRIKNFEFGDLKTDASIDHRVWRLTNLTAKSAGGTIQGVTTIFDRPATLGVATEPKVQGVPVQSFLKWFDITNTEMTGSVTLAGKLETVGKNDVERKQNLNGAFNMKIEDGTINRMRIVVQILNLLDLSRWFTFQLPDLTKEGIRFRAITGDFKVVKGVYLTENLVVDSNDLRMTAAGKIDVPKNELDLIVAVRPFAGIDTALNYIPLLGRGVAAIKNSFLVASFNIQGSIDNPTITPAPLGTLTEWFWGVLGIPKNMIGSGDGEKKEAPAQPPKTPAK